jgi:hypothetical protein
MLKFIMLKTFSTNSMVLISIRDLHSTGLRNECHKIFYTPKHFWRNVLQIAGKGHGLLLQSIC